MQSETVAVHRIAALVILHLVLMFSPQTSAQTFHDVPPDHWAYSYIEVFANNGITAGCGGGNYCPDDSVTRAQMAVFLERGRHGSWFVPPAATGNVFTDVGPGSFAANYIEHLAADRITSGCAQGIFCPNRTVTRDQMAVFLLRSKYGYSYSPPAPTGVFDDVPVEHWAAGWIEKLAAEGITAGCGNNNFCPNDIVSRAQMAVFLMRTFNLEYDHTAVLADLALFDSVLDQQFQPDILEYTATVGYLASEVSIIAKPGAEALNNVQVNGIWTDPGRPSEPVKLNVGDNRITVRVHGRNRGIRDYTITVNYQDANQFAQRASLKAEGLATDELFGSSVAIDHETLVVGAPHSNLSGTALVFVHDADGQWSQQAVLQASNGTPGDKFGASVSISGDRIAVGAPGVDINGTNSGAAYIFARNDSGVWYEEQWIRSGKNINNQDDNFGYSVSLELDTLVVGAPFDDGLGVDAGLVYIFHRDIAGFWQRTSIGGARETDGHNLGYSVSLSGDTLAVGVPGDDSDYGAVYLYTRTDGIWSGFRSGYLKPQLPGYNRRFGESVSLSGSQLAMGSPQDALVYEKTDGVWSQSAILLADQYAGWGPFSVSVDHGTVVVVVPGEGWDISSGELFYQGAAFIFVQDDLGGWNLFRFLKASDIGAVSLFGSSVALSFDSIVLGAPSSRAAYVFR